MIIPDAEFLQWMEGHPKAWLILRKIIKAGGSAQFTYEDAGMGKRQFFECIQELRPFLTIYREGKFNVYSIGNLKGNSTNPDKQRGLLFSNTGKGNSKGNLRPTEGNSKGNSTNPDKQRDLLSFDTEKRNLKGNSIDNIFNNISMDRAIDGAVTVAVAEQGQLELAGATATAVEKSPQKKAAERKKVADAFFTREFNELFWPGCLRKVSKGQARKAWISMRRQKRSDLSAEEMQKRYNQHYQEASDPKYSKHPATWLNGDCWEDEPDPVQQQTQEQQERVTQMTSRWVQSA